jgi:hypothetical protein
LLHIFVVVVNEGFAAHDEAALGQLVQPIGDVQQRIPLAKFQEGPWPTAVLRRYLPPSTDAHRGGSLRFEWQELLETDVVLPTIGEIVLIEETLPDTPSKVGESHLPCIVGEADATDVGDTILSTVKTKRFRCSSLQPRAVCKVTCSSAMVLSLWTSRRRQISGLMPRRTTRNW